MRVLRVMRGRSISGHVGARHRAHQRRLFHSMQTDTATRRSAPGGHGWDHSVGRGGARVVRAAREKHAWWIGAAGILALHGEGDEVMIRRGGTTSALALGMARASRREGQGCECHPRSVRWVWVWPGVTSANTPHTERVPCSRASSRFICPHAARPAPPLWWYI